jgi:hypothetical protein
MQENECNTVNEKQCKTEYSRECTTETERQCKTDFSTECSTTYEDKCTVVQDKECWDEQKQECKTEHEQECWEELEEKCSAHPECKTVVEEQCKAKFKTVCKNGGYEEGGKKDKKSKLFGKKFKRSVDDHDEDGYEFEDPVETGKKLMKLTKQGVLKWLKKDAEDDGPECYQVPETRCIAAPLVAAADAAGSGSKLTKRAATIPELGHQNCFTRYKTICNKDEHLFDIEPTAAKKTKVKRSLDEKLWKKLLKKGGHDEEEEECWQEPEGETCDKVPKEICNDVKSCHTVPVKRCKAVPVQNCWTVPVKQCKTVPRKECVQVPKENCVKVRKCCKFLLVNLPEVTCGSRLCPYNV